MVCACLLLVFCSCFAFVPSGVCLFFACVLFVRCLNFLVACACFLFVATALIVVFLRFLVACACLFADVLLVCACFLLVFCFCVAFVS